jgi:hypothetical protein
MGFAMIKEIRLSDRLYRIIPGFSHLDKLFSARWTRLPHEPSQGSPGLLQSFQPVHQIQPDSQAGGGRFEQVEGFLSLIEQPTLFCIIPDKALLCKTSPT